MSSWTESGEGRTHGGQHVRFRAPHETGRTAAAEALTLFDRIQIPENHQVNVEHGGYGRYSRYEIEQHEYGGGQNEVGGGYKEVLEIKDAPDGRHPIILHSYVFTGERTVASFSEWETVDAALAAFNHNRGSLYPGEDLTEQPGFIRAVELGNMSPWFYAVGNQELVGDYVFPEHLTDDPTYQYGRQFVVPERAGYDGNGRPRYTNRLKTCMGTMTYTRPERNHWGSATGESVARLVHWHDGTVTRLTGDSPIAEQPRPAQEHELWVADAQREFDRVLAGEKDKVVIRFADGGRFVGEYKAPKEFREAAAGQYYGEVTFDDGSEPRVGWFPFTPDEKNPTPEVHLINTFAERGKSVAKVEVTQYKEHEDAALTRRRRVGAFYPRPTDPE